MGAARANYFCLEKDYDKALSVLSMVQTKAGENNRLMELNIKSLYIKIYCCMGQTDRAQMFYEDAMLLAKTEYEKKELEQVMYGDM